MRLSHLSLTNFRNYARIDLAIPHGQVVIYGDNAQGKTSLLEAIYYLATSKSPYTTSDRQLINWMAQENEPIPFSRLVAEVQTTDEIRRVEVTLLLEKRGRNISFKKEIRINGVSRRVMDLLGQVRAVLFLPQDLSLVEGSPSLRRRYLDITLCQTDLDYCNALKEYGKVISQRNALLRQFQESGGRGDFSQLEFWDERLSWQGAVLVKGRYKLIRELEVLAQRNHRDLSGDGEHLRLIYEPGFDATDDESSDQMTFDTGLMGASSLPELPLKEMASRFREALKNRWKDDARRGLTTIGPQRDELRFLVNRRDLGLYGSRGQNRTAVLALKLAELDWMREQTGEWPILLLDEVAAELDPHRRQYLMARIKEAEQVFLTTTEPYLIGDSYMESAAKWHIQAGQIDVQHTPDKN